MLFKTVSEISSLLEKREISSSELTEMFIDNIKYTDKEIGAYLTVCEEYAYKSARIADDMIALGKKTSVLTGIPYALKDNIITKDIKTTAASKMLENFIPPFDSAVSSKLNECGGVLLGKLNMDEFGMGSSTRNSYFKITKNPCDKTKVPGGSSGGAAAAVVSGEAVYALGSDTGGSIRQPAAFCGCVGLNPTYGRVSRYGLISFASSLDRIGIMTRSVYDSALVLNEICGKDILDATSVGEKENFTEKADLGVKGLKIGIPDEFFDCPYLNANVKKLVMNKALQLEKEGARLLRVNIGSLEYATAAYYIISSCEASSNLARYDGVRYGHRAEKYDSVEELFENSRSEGFGDEVKRRILLGTFALSYGYFDEYYKKAVAAKNAITAALDEALTKCDVLLTPTTPTIAYGLDEFCDPTEEYDGDIFTVPSSLAGLPSVSVPCGKIDGLPVGLQIIGRRFDEKNLIRVGCAAFEEEKV